MDANKFMYFFKSAAYLVHRHILRKEYLTAKTNKYGLKVKFKTRDGGGRAIYKKDTYEEEITQLIINQISFETGDVFLDVGGNIGWYSLIVSSNFEGIEIFTFEPDPDNYNCLIDNIRINKLAGINPINKGVSSETGNKVLFQYKSSNTGRHSMLPINNGTKITVETVSIDDFLDEKALSINHVKLMKIDIEGFEYFAFLGAQKLLAKIPFIIAEYSPGYMKKGGVATKDLLEIMFKHNFTPFLIFHNTVRKVDLQYLLTIENNINLLWVKKGYALNN